MQSLTKTNVLFRFKKGWPQLFLNWVSCWKLTRKNVLCWGNCCQFGEQFLISNQPNLLWQLKSHIAFSMFPILDTNLWAWLTSTSINCHFLTKIVVDFFPYFLFLSVCINYAPLNTQCVVWKLYYLFPS